VIHHRRFASGFRACEMDGGTASHKDDDTQDVSKVTCAGCRKSLRARNSLPDEPEMPEAP